LGLETGAERRHPGAPRSVSRILGRLFTACRQLQTGPAAHVWDPTEVESPIGCPATETTHAEQCISLHVSSQGVIATLIRARKNRSDLSLKRKLPSLATGYQTRHQILPGNTHFYKPRVNFSRAMDVAEYVFLG
jgi:hypothetical protein